HLTATTAAWPPVSSPTLPYTTLFRSPAGAAINQTTGVFTWVPTEAQGPGTFPVTVRVTDNGAPALFAEETIAITVNEVNVPPVLSPTANNPVQVGRPLPCTPTATVAASPATTLPLILQ